MKSFRFRLLIAAMAVLLGTAIAKSQTTADATPPPMHNHEFGMGGEFHRMGFFADALNLTDDQKAQMKTIMHAAHPAMKLLFEQQHQIDQQLHQYVEGTYNDAKVRALAAQKAQVEVELTVAQTKLQNQLYQLLTPDQQSQLNELEANHESRMQQHMQNAPPLAPEE
ncbi:MAG TPA: Spy/CpxP family protein refolding chaperone [Candidatus Sulfotelmatobacter sp.]|nr:Spy/CpxP family protein refolding chaperone [Candidatus Sulfotelmatobacter sp.]